MAHGRSDLLAGLSGRLGNLVVYEMGGETVVRARVFRQHSRGTAALRERRAAFAQLARGWRSLTPAQQLAWISLGARMPDWDGARNSAALSGYQCWLTVGSGRAALGLTPLLDAPAAPDPPTFLPPLALAASASGGVLSAMLSCSPAPYMSAVQVLAARPSAPGGEAPRVKDCVQIALLPGLPDGGADIGPAYAARWGVPAPGLSITVRTVPLSQTGFRGQALSAPAIVEM